MVSISILPKFNLIDTDINKDSWIKSSAPLTPQGIRVSAVNDSSNSMVITWYTTSQASDPKLLLATEQSLIDNITIVPTLNIIDSTYIYSANLANLESETLYFYKLSSDASNEREVLNFTTLPPRNTTSIKFLIFGDSRSQREQRSEVVNKIIENFSDIQFSIHTGDIVNDGRIQTEWDEYFKDAELLTKKVPGYYIEGNHEYNNGYMYDNIPLPINGLNSYYYNFTIGPVNLIGLNTHRDPSVQTTWLETALNNSNNDNSTLWKIAYMHEPIFNSISTRPDRSDLIASWSPLFEQYNMDLIFAGHNHYYERSYPMNRLKQYDDSSSFYFKNPSYPMYFITGGAGAPLYTRDTSPGYAPFYNSTYHFLVVEISVDDINEETSLSLETWAMPDDYSAIFLIDNFTIIKRGAMIDIHNPINNELFGESSPDFNVSVNKVKLKPSWYTLNTTWYSLDEGETNYSYTGPIDKINQTVWDSAEDGDVKITFYANDSLGFIDSSEITIQKDSIAPNISILLPITNETFNASAPNFTVVISDIHLESMWYSIDGGIVNVSFISNTTIEPIEWNKLLNGTYLLTFYANDSVGNIASASVIIKKIIYEHLEDGKDGQEVILYTVIISSSIILTLGVISYTYLKLKKIKNNKIKEI
ncbi:MAG: purple acid phosphatase family protein [Candidatus Hodarchaeota archaeon]